MNVNEVLKRFDPAQEAGDADVAGMRATILTSRRPPRTKSRVVIACALLIAIVAAVVSLRRDEPQRPVPIVRKAPLQQQQATRQLRITTAGGTRLIWVFNDRLSM